MFKIFWTNFLKQEYYKLILSGLLTTIFVSTIALLIGLFLGTIFTILLNITLNKKLKYLDKFIKITIKLYIDIIRGTPIMVQLIFFWLVLFGSVNLSKITVGCIAFGLNSSAWISEIIRSGIISLDKGQLEGGLSLGLSKAQTFIYIIIPQVFKNMLPSLVNEYIALIKDTSLLSTIGAIDLARSGDIIIANTGNAIYPLFIIASCYLILTGTLSLISKRIENVIKKQQNRI